MAERRHIRLAARCGFFALFVLAPPLDVFRFDLTLGHFILFGQPWTLGLDPFVAGDIGPAGAAWNLTLRGFLPIAVVLGVLGWVSWHYGRMYCGWLCPHFSVVETINGLMRRAFGTPTLWEQAGSPRRPDGTAYPRHPAYAVLTALAVTGFALLWAVTLLTYLLPPAEIYHNILNFSLTRNQGLFLAVASAVFGLEFVFARHLFCRFGCAVGLFQSFVWMANPGARVVAMERAKARDCGACFAACDDVCPMRLKPRNLKRHMFACTQCGRCLDACTESQGSRGRESILGWVAAEQARQASRPVRGVAR